ncbi:MAG: hypothetical protein PVH93_02405 [Nitrosopumilaceae archaeon]
MPKESGNQDCKPNESPLDSVLQIAHLNPEYSNPELHAGVAELCALAYGKIAV